MSSTRGRTIRRRLQGVAFLVVLAALLSLSVAFYNKAFTDVATVTLKTDTVGNQLQEASDVKVRGVLVGEVRAVDADVDGATITLAIDPHDHTAAGLEALEGSITPRTQFLIANHMDAHAIRDGTIGHRTKLRLQESPDYEDLVLLGDLDRAGRQTGVQVCTIDEALSYIHGLEDQYA